MTPTNSDFKFVVDPSFAEMRAKLREIDRKWPKEIQKRNKKIAEFVAVATENEYSAEHPAQSGEGSDSIRALATQKSASVRIGSDAAPYVLGQNFGSNGGKNKHQFRRRNEPDYFLYTTVREYLPDIKKEYLKGVDEVMEEAFPN